MRFLRSNTRSGLSQYDCRQSHVSFLCFSHYSTYRYHIVRKWGFTEWVLKAAMILDSANSQSSSTYALLTKPCVVWRTWSSTTKKLNEEKTSQNSAQIKSFNDHNHPKTALQAEHQNPGNSAAQPFGFWLLFQTSSHDYPVQKIIYTYPWQLGIHPPKH